MSQNEKELITCPCCGHSVLLDIHIKEPEPETRFDGLTTIETWRGCECNEWLAKHPDALDEYHDECLEAADRAKEEREG